jgi:hypothetical protein
MSATHVPLPLQQFVDDEMLRAPLLFDQVLEGGIDQLRKSLPTQSPMQRAITSELMQAMQGQRNRLCDYFMRSLREQVREDLAWHLPKLANAAATPLALALVDEEVVAMDVELSHTIEAIKSTCEHELRELQTYTSALVGDMDVSRDHNPFRADVYTRALSASTAALPLSKGHQVLMMRNCSTPLAQLLRKSYAAASSRLESQGIEPAAYRTVILPSGARSSGRFGETTFSPDMHRMRDSMPAALSPAVAMPAAGRTQAVQPPSHAPHTTRAMPAGAHSPLEHWSTVAGSSASRIDRQAVELVSRLFESMLTDERLPPDAGQVIARLHGPALRMTLRDATLLDQEKHPLWRFINRFCYEVQMSPGTGDPERLLLLKMAHGVADQLAAEPEQSSSLYRWALDRLDSFLQKRFTRRLSAASSHIGALQKLEDKLTAGNTTPSTMHGMLDVAQMDTVPAELMDTAPVVPGSRLEAEDWLDSLNPGDWVRMFLQGRWVHAALLWPGERHEVWLFGDGASDATWAVRRGALLMMHGTRLAKRLKQRNIVGSAAARVQEQLAASSAA